MVPSIILHLEHTDAYRAHPVHIELEEFSDVRFKQSAVIEFLTAEKVLPIEIQRRMQAFYGDRCVDVSTVRRWVRCFKDGRLGFKNKTPFFLRTDLKN
jgi:transposase